MYGISVLFNFNVVRFHNVRCTSNSTKKLLEFLAEMPNNKSPRIADSQRQRRIINKKSDKYSPSNVYLQVLGSGARGVPNTLYLFTDHKRYLFNCGESTQRLAHEHKVKLSKLDHIFITTKTWQNIGGLPGLSLTLQDVGVPNITLHGPEGLDELYNATKRFVIMKDMNVTMADCENGLVYEDSCMTVRYVILKPPDDFLRESLLNVENKEKPAKRPKLNPAVKQYEDFMNDDTDYYPETKQKKSPKESPKKRPEKIPQDLPKKKRICSVAYICKLRDRPGALDLEKCVEKGVKPGPMLGQLKNGHDVFLPDGTLVKSRDVKTPDDPGPVFIVMEVLDLLYLDENDFLPHFDNGKNAPANIPVLIVHFTPPHIFNHPRYRLFLSQFGPTTRHLVLNSQNACLGSEAVHRSAHKLHLLDSEIFPLLRDASLPALWNTRPPTSHDSPAGRGLEELKNKIAFAQFQSIINMEGSKGDGQVCNQDGENKLEIITGKTLTMYHLRPKRALDRSLEPKLHIQEYIQETMDMDGFVGSLEQFRRMVDKVRYEKRDQNPTEEYPKVIFLGTGSCIPGKTRNTSAIVLQINENSSILMDCGEGTFGQLVRFFGQKKVNAFLRTLNVIYISHLHADHHIGLIGVLQARRQAFLQNDEEPWPVYLLAPGQIYSWLLVYDHMFEKIMPDLTLVPNQSLVSDSNQNSDLSPAMYSNVGIHKIVTCYVSHCPNAFGVAIHVDENVKITYSGDTIPCDALVNIGQNSTLLIHEATMEDELATEARIKMHSTTSQAIGVGQKMNAKYIVLTHFSQRYARLPRLNQSILSGNKTIGIAFDNMQITLNDLELLPYMYAPLQLMFAEHCVEMEIKAAHRHKSKGLTEKHGANEAVDVQKLNLNSIVVHEAPRINYKETNSSRLRQKMKGMGPIGVVKNTGRSKSLTPGPTAIEQGPSDQQDGFSSKTDNSKSEIISIAEGLSLSPTCSRFKNKEDRKSTTSSTCSIRSGLLITTPKKFTANKRKFTPKQQPNSSCRIAKCYANKDKHSISSTSTIELTPNNSSQSTTVARNSGVNEDKMSNNCSASSNSSISKSTALSQPGIKDKPLKTTPTKTVTPSASICRTLGLSKTQMKKNPLPHPRETPKSAALSRNSPAKLKTETRILSVQNEQQLDSPNSGIEPNPPQMTPTRLKDETKIRNFSKFPRPASAKCPINTKSNVNSTCLMESTDATCVTIAKTNCNAKQTRPKQLQQVKLSNPPTSHLRNLCTEKLKQQFCRDLSMISTGRANSCIHSTYKTFKPQLEDIKSSNLILNEVEKESDTKNLGNNVKKGDDKTKQKPWSEDIRKTQLELTKKKFKSRGYVEDSRYEKIEGLNWITW